MVYHTQKRQLGDKKILVIIPAYNEESVIRQVIEAVRKEAPGVDIAVVNDGSTDETSKVAYELGVDVLNLPYNLGIGGAMQTGFKFARDKGYDFAFQVDGDGQHDPRSVWDLLEPLVEDRADVVVGSRYIEDRGYATPVSRRVGMKLFSSALSLIMGQKMTDTTSGFRGVNREAIAFFAENYPTDYPEVEALVLSHFARLRIQEVPVLMRERKSGRSSITPFRSVYYMAKVTLAVLIWLIRKKPNRREGGDIVAE